MRSIAAFLRESLWPPLVLVVGASLLATHPVLDGGLVLDDDQRFVRNQAWRGLGPEQLVWIGTTFHTATYEPLTWITCALDHAVPAS